MNTTPDEEILALWVEDELHGPQLAQVDAWAVSQPEWLSHREDARRTKSLLRAILPAAEEPPYAEFFNARIAREIATLEVQDAPQSSRKPRRWLTWAMPTAAAAGMALCFWAGTYVPPGNVAAGGAPHHPATSAYEPSLYTPESGVKAAWYASTAADSSIIVLDGVAAIPDSFEIPETAAVQEPHSTTAENDTAR